MRTWIVCECDSWQCDERVPISDEDYGKLKRGHFVVASTCSAGVNPKIVGLVECRDGYTIYQDLKAQTLKNHEITDTERMNWLEQHLDRVLYLRDIGGNRVEMQTSIGGAVKLPAVWSFTLREVTDEAIRKERGSGIFAP